MRRPARQRRSRHERPRPIASAPGPPAPRQPAPHRHRHLRRGARSGRRSRTRGDGICRRAAAGIRRRASDPSGAQRRSHRPAARTHDPAAERLPDRQLRQDSIPTSRCARSPTSRRRRRRARRTATGRAQPWTPVRSGCPRALGLLTPPGRGRAWLPSGLRRRCGGGGFGGLQPEQRPQAPVLRTEALHLEAQLIGFEASRSPMATAAPAHQLSRYGSKLSRNWIGALASSCQTTNSIRPRPTSTGRRCRVTTRKRVLAMPGQPEHPVSSVAHTHTHTLYVCCCI